MSCFVNKRMTAVSTVALLFSGAGVQAAKFPVTTVTAGTQTPGEAAYWKSATSNTVYVENSSEEDILYLYFLFENQDSEVHLYAPVNGEQWKVVSHSNATAPTLTKPIPHYTRDCTEGLTSQPYSYPDTVTCVCGTAGACSPTPITRSPGQTCVNSEYCSKHTADRRDPTKVGAGTWQILELPKGESATLQIPTFRCDPDQPDFTNNSICPQGTQAFSIIPLKFKELPPSQVGTLCPLDMENLDCSLHQQDPKVPCAATWPTYYTLSNGNYSCPCDPKYEDCGAPVRIEAGRKMVGDMSAVDGVNFNMRLTLTHSNEVATSPTTIDFSGNPCKAIRAPNNQGCANIPAANPGKYGDAQFQIVNGVQKKAGDNTDAGKLDVEAWSPCWHATCNLQGDALKYCNAVHHKQCSNSSTSKKQGNSINTRDPACVDQTTQKQTKFTTYCYNYDDQNSQPVFGSSDASGAVYTMSVVFSTLSK